MYLYLQIILIKRHLSNNLIFSFFLAKLRHIWTCVVFLCNFFMWDSYYYTRLYSAWTVPKMLHQHFLYKMVIFIVRRSLFLPLGVCIVLVCHPVRTLLSTSTGFITKRPLSEHDPNPSSEKKKRRNSSMYSTKVMFFCS